MKEDTVHKMKKKILFIISNLETGGVSKSMTSLMNVIDRERYDVSLMIVSSGGPLMELLPKDLRIITNPVWDALTDRLAGVSKLLRLGHPLLAAGHCIRLFMSRFSKSIAGRMIARMMPAIHEDFDVIVDYNGQQQLYYMVDKLNAKKKLTFFHNDYKKWPYYYSADKKYFPKVDSIYTISDICIQSLQDVFPEVKEKIHLIENISSLKLLEGLALRLDVSKEIRQDIPTILTIGHLCDRKGTHWALQAASILKNRGIEFHWYFLGKNLDVALYEQMRQDLGLKANVSFLGVRVNPYPYIKSATIISHQSRFEGKSIALDEVKLLCKPTVVTNFSTVTDQFTDRVNASICEMNPECIADSIEELLADEQLRNKYRTNLHAQRRDNSSEIEKLYKVFDD